MATRHGFALLRAREIPELNSRAELYRHERTGAELLSMINEDENKVFGVGFRTVPADSTGIAHILEHVVLAGSQKYPVKEPFIELVKGSLASFVNAMTFEDRTVYPIASPNLQDFYNLIDVYLDAVFHPLLQEERFMREGWHYALESQQGSLDLRGVVFNEMKGPFSTPDYVLFHEIMGTLFPDTTYAHASGGNPSFIPDLTFKRFRAFYETYYHPSNARIFFYGDDPPEEEDREEHHHQGRQAQGRRAGGEARLHRVIIRQHPPPGQTAGRNPPHPGSDGPGCGQRNRGVPLSGFPAMMPGDALCGVSQAVSRTDRRARPAPGHASPSPGLPTESRVPGTGTVSPGGGGAVRFRPLRSGFPRGRGDGAPCGTRFSIGIRRERSDPVTASRRSGVSLRFAEAAPVPPHWKEPLDPEGPRARSTGGAPACRWTTRPGSDPGRTIHGGITHERSGQGIR